MQTVLSFNNQSQCLSLQENDISFNFLSEKIFAVTGVREAHQRIILNGRDVSSCEDLLFDRTQTNFIQLQLRVLGGKVNSLSSLNIILEK
jgi:hypothetical protein